MLYKRKYYENWWFGSTPISRNPHIPLGWTTFPVDLKPSTTPRWSHARRFSGKPDDGNAPDSSPAPGYLMKSPGTAENPHPNLPLWLVSYPSSANNLQSDRTLANSSWSICWRFRAVGLPVQTSCHDGKNSCAGEAKGERSTRVDFNVTTRILVKTETKATLFWRFLAACMDCLLDPQ